MKGYLGFNNKFEEILYVEQNFVLTFSGKSPKLDTNKNHLEELTLYFSENPVDPGLARSIEVPEELLDKFRRYFNKCDANLYPVALEIFDYCKNLDRNKKLTNNDALGFAIRMGYGGLIKCKNSWSLI